MRARCMRVVFFGSAGGMTVLPLQAVSERHDVLAVVRASPRSRPLWPLLGRVAQALGLRRSDPLSAWAHRRRVPCLFARGGADAALAGRLRELRPDLFCVSAFRYLLQHDLLGIPGRGSLNLHASLLPRHRGPVPWFWVYHRDDRETGVTVHWMDERADAGAIVAQERFPLSRGMRVDRLAVESARLGARLLAGVLERVDAGATPGVPQEEARVTLAPIVKRGARMVDFAEWGAERVWHFLAGLAPRFREPLFDRGGRPVAYADVLGFELAANAGEPAGVVSRQVRGLALQCRDGCVWLEGA
jgi:methionyl-tRNA formyltransferase